jgi:hypothetical protein
VSRLSILAKTIRYGLQEPRNGRVSGIEEIESLLESCDSNILSINNSRKERRSPDRSEVKRSEDIGKGEAPQIGKINFESYPMCRNENDSFNIQPAHHSTEIESRVWVAAGEMKLLLIIVGVMLRLIKNKWLPLFIHRP